MKKVSSLIWDTVFAHELGHYVAQKLYEDSHTNLGVENIGFYISEGNSDADSDIKGWVTPIKPQGLPESKTIPLERLASFFSKISHGCIFQAVIFPGEKLFGMTPYRSCFNRFSESRGKCDHKALNDHIELTFQKDSSWYYNKIDQVLDDFIIKCTQSKALDEFANIKVEKYIPTAYLEVKGTFEISGDKLSELETDCKPAIENYRDRFFELHNELDVIVKTEFQESDWRL